MKTREITYCALCGLARLNLKHGLCRDCERHCENWPDTLMLDDAAIERLMDDLGLEE